MKITELFQRGEFVVTAEVGPPKGFHIEGLIQEAKEYLSGVTAVNVTDNQSSVMRLGSLATLEDTLVVWGESVYTEDSRTFPATAKLYLHQGTTLELAHDVEAGTLVTNRGIYGNHVVWMPTRADDGTLVRQLALVSASAAVNEGYLPLTEANIARVALRPLGKAYGWGGSLMSNDCSGYARDVFKCFGLELARNTNWQRFMEARTIDMSGMDSAQKAKLVESLPLGAILYISGHEMIYLGHEGDQQYVTSSISSIGSATTGVTISESIWWASDVI